MSVVARLLINRLDLMSFVTRDLRREIFRVRDLKIISC